MLQNGQIIRIMSERELNEKGLSFKSNLNNLQDKEFILRINEDGCLLEHIDGRLVEDEDGEILSIDISLITKAENTKIKELKVGDKITFLDTLLPFKRYGDILATMYITTFKGRECKVTHINNDNTFRIEEDDNEYSFSRGMTKEYTL